MIGLSASTYYYRPKVSELERERRDADLKEQIEAIQLEHPSYGYRRILHQLRRAGQRVNAKRIRRVMAKYQLEPAVWKTFTRTTDSNHSLQVFENRLRGRVVSGVNQAWVADLTYIRIVSCFVYLAVILDLFSRKVIGWALSKRLEASLCLEALRMAIAQRRPEPGCIHHSDRGVQYASAEYVFELKEHLFDISMSAKGNPYQNAFAESFLKTLKYEEVHLWNYETYDDVLERVPYFIEQVYNQKRLHSALGYRPPTEFEQLFLSGQLRRGTGKDPTVIVSG